MDIRMSRQTKVLTSCAIYFSTFATGFGYSMLGPSLIELSLKFQTDISTISKVFLISTIAYLIGAMSNSVLFNYVNRQVLASMLLMVMGAELILLPQAPSLLTFFTITGIIGFTFGGYNTAQIVWIIEMWANPRVFIQLQHFCFALGITICPLVVKPFLTIDSEEILPLSSTLNQFGNKLFIPFTIAGSVVILGGFSLLFLFYFNKYQKQGTDTDTGILSSDDILLEDQFNKERRKRPHQILLIILSAIFLGVYQGMEVCTIQFFPTFTHYIDLRLSKQDGALVMFSLTGAFTIGRGIGVLAVLRLLPQVLLLGNMSLVLLGNLTLLLLGHSYVGFLWTGSVLTGFGFSTVFPCFYGYIEQHLEITNVVGGVMIVADGVLTAIYPLLIGTLIQHNPFILIYTNLFSLIVATITFLVVFVVTSGHARHTHRGCNAR